MINSVFMFQWQATLAFQLKQSPAGIWLGGSNWSTCLYLLVSLLFIWEQASFTSCSWVLAPNMTKEALWWPGFYLFSSASCDDTSINYLDTFLGLDTDFTEKWSCWRTVLTLVIHSQPKLPQFYPFLTVPVCFSGWQETFDAIFFTIKWLPN